MLKNSDMDVIRNHLRGLPDTHDNARLKLLVQLMSDNGLGPSQISSLKNRDVHSGSKFLPEISFLKKRTVVSQSIPNTTRDALSIYWSHKRLFGSEHPLIEGQRSSANVPAANRSVGNVKVLHIAPNTVCRLLKVSIFEPVGLGEHRPLELVKLFRLNNPGLYQKQQMVSPPNKAKYSFTMSHKKDSPEFIMTKFIRNSIIRAMNYSTFTGEADDCLLLEVDEILEYDMKQLSKHIELGFEDGMGWKNYGPSGWVIDHKRPLASYASEGLDFKELLRRSLRITNLRPMWADENLEKNSFFLGSKTTRYDNLKSESAKEETLERRLNALESLAEEVRYAISDIRELIVRENTPPKVLDSESDKCYNKKTGS